MGGDGSVKMEPGSVNIELGQLSFTESEFNSLEGGRITSHHGVLSERPVRVVCIETDPPGDKVEELSVQNFQFFVDSLTRIDSLSRCVGVWDWEDKINVCYKCFVFEEFCSMTLDELLLRNIMSLDERKLLLEDIAIVVRRVLKMGFAIPCLNTSDVLIMELDHRFRPRLTGMESWKFFGDDSNLLVMNGSYDGRSKTRNIGYEHTQLALAGLFEQINKNVDLGEEASGLFNNLISQLKSGLRHDLSLVRCHPYFWEINKCVEFYLDVNEWLADKPSVWADINTQVTCGLYDNNDWHAKLDGGVLQIIKNGFLKEGMEVSDFPKTTGKVGYLICAVRFYYMHVKNTSKDEPHHLFQSLYEYFAGVFPSLLLFVYKFVSGYRNTNEDDYVMQKYFS